jgi:hypothetical protein
VVERKHNHPDPKERARREWVEKEAIRLQRVFDCTYTKALAMATIAWRELQALKKEGKV